MADTPPDTVAEPQILETGLVRWFNADKNIGLIGRADGSTIFIPPFGLPKDHPPLHPGQRVSFVVKTRQAGLYAIVVQVIVEIAVRNSAAAAQIVETLGESIPPALAQIRRVVRYLGAEAALLHLAEAQRIDAADGLMLPDGSRRRTLGGVFFFVVKAAISPEQRELIFPPLHVRKALWPRPGSDKQGLGQPPPPPSLIWQDRLALLETLKPQSGKAFSVKIMLIGRPTKIDEQPQFTLLTLIHNGPFPPLAKGVPRPDPVPATTYSVYISKKQWKPVAAALQNPEDTLIVEGTQMLDAATGTIAVFATKTTTKLIQQASRRPKSPTAPAHRPDDTAEPPAEPAGEA